MKFLLFIVLFFPLTLRSQVVINGTVTDTKNQPLPGANIYIEGTYNGASADINGHFVFYSALDSTSTLVVTFVGFEQYTLLIKDVSDSLYVHVILREEIDRLNDVVISAGSISTGNQNTSEILEPLDIVTTAGATADITGALNTLPGTSTVAENGRLFVRGGSDEETKTYIDGLLAAEPYGQAMPGSPVRNRFSPFMFTGTAFSTGGYSSEFGNALSSTLDLKSRDNISMTRADISLMSVGVEGTYSLKKEKYFMINKVFYNDLTPYYTLLPNKNEFLKMPQSLGHNFFYGFRSKKGLVKVFSQWSNSNMKVRFEDYPNDTVFDLHIGEKYFYLNTNYRHALNKKWSSFSGMSFGHQVNKMALNSVDLGSKGSDIHLKQLFYYDPDTYNSVKMGVEQVVSRKDSALYALDNNYVALFSEWEHYFNKKLILRSGIRYNSYSNKGVFLPRISLTGKVTEVSQLSFSYGLFSQSYSNLLFEVYSFEAIPEKSEHLIVNYQYNKNNRLFRIEGFNKKYKNLVYRSENLFFNNGGGYARGFDVFYRDNESIKNTDFWITYSYLDTKRNTRFYPIYEVPSYWSAHKFNLVVKTFVSGIKTQFGFSTTYSTPRYFHNPNKTGEINDNSNAYLDLSLNFSHLLKPSVIIHGSVSNVTGRKNEFGYEYRTLKNTEGIYEGRPITLSAPRFIFLGVFITISKNITANQLPNL
ncbi:MAG: TonB-dependent receptor [Cyclobacteriaceae bacterium]|nr:TonB-dependent receptor [Cyclobacteriaceae bacterium]